MFSPTESNSRPVQWNTKRNPHPGRGTTSRPPNEYRHPVDRPLPQRVAAGHSPSDSGKPTSPRSYSRRWQRKPPRPRRGHVTRAGRVAPCPRSSRGHAAHGQQHQTARSETDGGKMNYDLGVRNAPEALDWLLDNLVNRLPEAESALVL